MDRISEIAMHFLVNAAWQVAAVRSGHRYTLCKALVSDNESEVRRTTAWALGEIQSRKAVSFLRQGLSDPDERVRAKVYWAYLR